MIYIGTHKIRILFMKNKIVPAFVEKNKNSDKYPDIDITYTRGRI